MENKHRKAHQINKTVSTRTLMYVGIFFIFNLLCLFQLEKFSSGALLLTGLVLLIGLLIRYDEVGIYLFICLAFFNVMNANVQSTSLFYILCGIVVVRYFAQERQKYKLPQKLVLLCIIFMVTAYNLPDTRRYFSWFILLLTCIFLYRERIITTCITDIVTLFSLAFLFASGWGYLMLQNGMAINNGSAMFLSGNYSYLRFAGLVGDSVMFGGIIIVLIAANLVLMMTCKKQIWLRLFFVIAMTIFGILTYSKTFYVGMIIEVVLFLWFWLCKEKGKLKAFFLTVIVTGVIVAGVIVWLSYGTDNVASIMRERVSAEDLSTGRLVAWEYYVDRWLHDWTIVFKGIGFAEYAMRRSYAGYTHSVMYAHNILIESITAFGLLETGAVLTGMGIALKRFLNQHVGLIWLLPAFMLFAVFGIISHGHFESIYYFCALLVVTIPGADARNAILGVKEEK